MATDQPAEPLPGVTYRGFSTPPVPPARPRRPPYAVALLGVAGAVAMGLTLGLWAKPELDRPETPAAPQAQQNAPEAPQKMNVEVAPPTPLVTPAPATQRLEVLPRDMAHVATAAQALPPPPAPLLSTPRPLPVEAAVPAPAHAVPAPQPGFDCSDARGVAEGLICRDPNLARAERRMAQAYRRALASSDAPEQLRDEQQDWLAIREDAARQSPDVLALVYRQRIAELETASGEDDR